jgi:hypothetical protein
MKLVLAVSIGVALLIGTTSAQAQAARKDVMPEVKVKIRTVEAKRWIRFGANTGQENVSTSNPQGVAAMGSQKSCSTQIGGAQQPQSAVERRSQRPNKQEIVYVKGDVINSCK